MLAFSQYKINVLDNGYLYKDLFGEFFFTSYIYTAIETLFKI